MPVEAFQFEADLEHGLDGWILIALVLEARLAFNRLSERYRIGRVHRDQFAQAIDLTVRHLENAADIAAHRTGLQFSESDDLRHTLLAVPLLDIMDNLVTPVLAEIDVE